MKKQNLVECFVSGKCAKYSNYETDGNFLKLHGSIIAKKENGKTSISLCGYNTHTTKTTLNLINGCHIVQKKGELYLNEKPINSNDWYDLE